LSGIAADAIGDAAQQSLVGVRPGVVGPAASGPLFFAMTNRLSSAAELWERSCEGRSRARGRQCER
jgi:hypothetical protein